MKPSYYLILILLAIVGVQQVTIKSVRADFREQRALVKPLQNALTDSTRISEGHRTALDTCEAEKLRVAQANATAAQAAADNAAVAAKQAEDYFRALVNPPKGQQCEAFLASHICPALMDY